MELRHVRYFVVAAEELHFRCAAQRLEIAQPALSQQIARLEEDLGVTLFDRGKRRVLLTGAGKVFLKEARRMLAHVQRAVDATRRAGRGEIGLLDVGFIPAADYTVFPKILPVFQKRCPAVQLALHNLGVNAQIDALHEGLIDVAFLRLPIDDRTLVVEWILREPLLVALPTNHPLAARRELPLRALANERYIFFPRQMAPAFYDSIVSFCQRAGFSPKVSHETDHLQTSLTLVASGLGVSLVPASIRALGLTGVDYRPLRPPVPYLDMGMAYRREDSSEVLRVFIDTVREVAKASAR